MLYLAQGFPQGVLFTALPSWLAVNGQPAASVGLVASASLLPWSLKFLVGGFVDRYAYLAMGRRRSWLIGAQFAIIALFLTFAAIQPDPGATILIAGLAFCLSSATAIQDIALDALVIDLTPEEELGRLNSFMFAGKLIGVAGGSAFTAFLIESYSIRLAMIGAMIFFMIPAIAALLIRERPGEKLLPWTKGSASAEALAVRHDNWWRLLKTAFSSLIRADVFVVLALMVMYGFHQQVLDNSIALFAANEMGWGETRFSGLLASVNIVSAIFCLSLLGWLIDRRGPKMMALIAGFAGAMSITTLIFGKFIWGTDALFIAWYVVVTLSILPFYLAMLVMAMRVTDQATAATNFNVLMAGLAMGGTLGGASLGTIDGWGGFEALFGVAAGVLVLSASCAFLLSGALGPVSRKDAHDLGSDEMTAIALP